MHTIKCYVSLVLMIASALVFTGCGSRGQSTDNDDEELTYNAEENESQTSDVNYDPDAMNELISSFPSPVETAALLEDSQVPFNPKYLQDPDKTRDFAKSFKKALGLGVLSADLGYLNVYSKTGQVVEYLAAIRTLAEDLKVGQFFDFQSLKRLATTEDNVDSLLMMCVQSYQDMSSHLQRNQRSNLSVLLVTGVWVESLYLITQVAKESYSDDFKDRIGEQKQILNQLLPILKLFEKDKDFEKLVEDLGELKDAFEVVKIETIVEEPQQIESNGALVIVQNEKSVVEVSKDELNEIIRKTEKIRNKLIAQ